MPTSIYATMQLLYPLSDAGMTGLPWIFLKSSLKTGKLQVLIQRILYGDLAAFIA
jgi:hypothetical protein